MIVKKCVKNLVKTRDMGITSFVRLGLSPSEFPKRRIRDHPLTTCKFSFREWVVTDKWKFGWRGDVFLYDRGR